MELDINRKRKTSEILTDIENCTKKLADLYNEYEFILDKTYPDDSDENYYKLLSEITSRGIFCKPTKWGFDIGPITICYYKSCRWKHPKRDYDKNHSLQYCYNYENERVSRPYFYKDLNSLLKREFFDKGY